MTKKSVIMPGGGKLLTVRVPATTYDRMMNKMDRDGFMTTSEYLRRLINQDLATTND